MNEWLVAAVVFLALLVPCLVVCSRASPIAGLVALELSGSMVTSLLLVLAAGFNRQPFVDLALVFAVLSFAGSLAFARLLERRI